MPYNIRKRKCKQTDGDSGGYVLSYKDKSGEHHSACHTSKKKALAQIGAIERKKAHGNRVKLEGNHEQEKGNEQVNNELKNLIRQLVSETMMEMSEAAASGREDVKTDAAEHPKKGKLSNPDDPVDDGKKGTFADIMAHRIEKSGVYGTEEDILKKAKSVARYSKIKK